MIANLVTNLKHVARGFYPEKLKTKNNYVSECRISRKKLSSCINLAKSSSQNDVHKKPRFGKQGLLCDNHCLMFKQGKTRYSILLGWLALETCLLAAPVFVPPDPLSSPQRRNRGAFSCAISLEAFVSELHGQHGWEFQNWDSIGWNLNHWQPKSLGQGTLTDARKTVSRTVDELLRVNWGPEDTWPQTLKPGQHLRYPQWEQIGIAKIKPERLENSVVAALTITEVDDGRFETRLVTGELWSINRHTQDGQDVVEAEIIPLKHTDLVGRGTGPAVLEGKPEKIVLSGRNPAHLLLLRNAAIESRIESRIKDEEKRYYYFSSLSGRYLVEYRQNFLGCPPVGRKQYYNEEHRLKVQEEMRQTLKEYSTNRHWKMVLRTDLKKDVIIYGWFEQSEGDLFEMRIGKVRTIDVNGSPPNITLKIGAVDPYDGRSINMVVPLNSISNQLSVLK
ncbi:MAG: hypothetical protein HYR96_08245 [Deltaproteobacteria bacterium]|nr:hypothetical protein [Deltaproteobacteria bacterium]MBI3293497.1 hypothetical protein [Deltaproteobacteria bacterium]